MVKVVKKKKKKIPPYSNCVDEKIDFFLSIGRDEIYCYIKIDFTPS